MGQAITLNKANSNVAFAIVCVVTAVAIIGALLSEMAFAAGGGGTFIGDGADNLLKDFSTVIALAGVAIGIFNIVKGRTVMGIGVLVIAAVLFVFCTTPTLFGTVGKAIVNIFNW